MIEHYDQLAGAGAAVGRPDWISATEQFTKLGLTNRKGEPLNAGLVRKTWSRVVNAVEAQRAAVQRAGQPSQPGTSNAAIQPGSPFLASPPDGKDPPPASFSFVKAR